MTMQRRRVILTGASGGIGRSIAKALAAQGHELLLCGRNNGKLAILLDELEGSGHQLLVADLTTTAGITSLQSAANAFEADTLINGMGVNQLTLLADSSIADGERILATNLLAPINVCRALLPLFQHKQATIVNIGSILGNIGYPGSTLYCASKAGLQRFTESLRRELTDTEIAVLYFAPRATGTELNSPAMREMNQQLGNKTDSPNWVAEQLCLALRQQKQGDIFLGWPESLFVRINALLPRLVDNSILKQLPVIKRFCRGSNHPQHAVGEHHEVS
ncbi:SDR family oxidoreductase [Shewanella yunxiaonensis]|uniref:SDR family oxidoreductase n=1 Tax=Shewanella yunxiaonensis TaxID=2829809 RepID=A0ABX7YQP6_9GAMM|nr:SDR family oxidoreductase [Shewanella yunxiaonensis]QUN05042.1 SDR family oxidoreductase [Shewanella yunxiaonensis]